MRNQQATNRPPWWCRVSLVVRLMSPVSLLSVLHDHPQPPGLADAVICLAAAVPGCRMYICLVSEGAAGVGGGPAASTVEWLDRFNMGAQVLRQLVSLRPRVVEATGSGIFSGEQAWESSLDAVAAWESVVPVRES